MAKIVKKNWNTQWRDYTEHWFVEFSEPRVTIETTYSASYNPRDKYHNNIANNSLNSYFTDIYIDFLEKIKYELSIFSYLLFGLGFVFDFLIFTNHFLWVKIKNIYYLLCNIIIIIWIWFSLKIFFNHIFQKIWSYHMGNINFAFENGNILNVIYHTLLWSWVIDKYIIILALLLIISYIVIGIFNLMDILFWYNFHHIKYTKNNYHIYIAKKTFNIKSIEYHNEFIENNFRKILIYWVSIGIFIYSLIYFPVLGYIESLRIMFWLSIVFLLLFIVIYIFFIFIFYLIKNPIIFSFHRLMIQLDQFAFLDKEFKYNIERFKQGYIEESFWQSLGNTFIHASKIKKMLKDNPKLHFYSRNNNFHTSIQDIIDYNIQEYMVLFDEVLEFIDERKSDIYFTSFQEKAEMYRRKVLDMKKKFLNIKSS